MAVPDNSLSMEELRVRFGCPESDEYSESTVPMGSLVCGRDVRLAII